MVVVLMYLRNITDKFLLWCFFCHGGNVPAGHDDDDDDDDDDPGSWVVTILMTLTSGIASSLLLNPYEVNRT